MTAKKKGVRAQRAAGEGRGMKREPGSKRDVRATRAEVRRNREELLKPPPLPNADEAVAAIEDTPEDVKARLGRPPVQIKWDDFELKCGDWGTLQEIAAANFCSTMTLERKVHARYGMPFVEVSAQLRAARVGSLRRAGFLTALKGNATMLKHFLNNYGGTAEIHRLQTTEDARRYLSEALGIRAADLPPTGEAT